MLDNSVNAFIRAGYLIGKCCLQIRPNQDYFSTFHVIPFGIVCMTPSMSKTSLLVT